MRPANNPDAIDVIVIGGGHAGIEAANSACKIVKKVVLITLSLQKIGLTPCNPSIGGSAKGIVVCEISALGGLMDKIADKAALQTKILNSSNGPAVQSLRSQIDKLSYPKIAVEMLNLISNLTIIEDQVIKLLIKNKQIIGVSCVKTGQIFSSTVVLTTGTFMNSVIFQGVNAIKSAGDNQKTTWRLSKNLIQNGINLTRFKTGTPPRVDASTINYNKCSKMMGSDNADLKFSFFRKKSNHLNIPCYLTFTNSKTHKCILNHHKESVLHWNKNIGAGPRYCPSIEEKIFRFRDKSRHQLFLEPESLHTHSVYVQGFSTSLSKEAQNEAIRTIEGLEQARIIKYGYAIEYDAVVPCELKQTLELKKIENLFTAGQINCTSGYEEAAAQGLVAGVNAGLKAINSKKSLIFLRDEAYIGVMISDLLFKNITEPYRLLTGLAEYRLLLRGGNAQLRLYKKAFKFNLISHSDYIKIDQIENNIYEIKKIIKSTDTTNQNKQINQWLKKNKLNELHCIISFAKLLRRPEVCIFDILPFLKFNKKYTQLELKEAEVQIKYEYYLKMQASNIKEMKVNSKIKLPQDINYSKIVGLSREAECNLQKFQPRNYAQLLLISGVRIEDAIKVRVHLKAHS